MKFLIILLLILWKTNRKDVEILIMAELAQGLWYLRRKLLPVLWWQHLFQSGEIFALRKVYFKVNICLFIPFLFMFHHSEAPILLLGLHFYSFYIGKTGNKKILFYVENVLWQQLRLKWFICSTLHNICEKFTEKVKCNIVLQKLWQPVGWQRFAENAIYPLKVRKSSMKKRRNATCSA